MTILDPDQLDAMSQKVEEDFLLECVSDWFALRQAAYGTPPRLPFDNAWAIARHVWDRVQGLPQPPWRPVEYSLIHAVLQCGENGATAEQLRRGLETYCRSLPSHDAGLILLEALCAPPTTRNPA